MLIIASKNFWTWLDCLGKSANDFSFKVMPLLNPGWNAYEIKINQQDTDLVVAFDENLLQYLPHLANAKLIQIKKDTKYSDEKIFAIVLYLLSDKLKLDWRILGYFLKKEGLVFDQENIGLAAGYLQQM